MQQDRGSTHTPVRQNAHMARQLRRASWVTAWAGDRSVQAGVAGASWSVAGTLARGLLPRSPLQQAVATGVVATAHFQLTATAWSALEALASKPGARPTLRASIIVAAGAMAGGVAASAATAPVAGRSLPAAAAGTAGRIVAFAGLAGGAAACWGSSRSHGAGPPTRSCCRGCSFFFLLVCFFYGFFVCFDIIVGKT